MFLISEMQGCPKNQNFRPPWPIPTVVVILGLLSNCMAIGAFLAFSVCNFFFGTPCIYCIVVYESIGNSVRFLHLIMLDEAAEGLRRRSLVVSLGSRNERFFFFKNMQTSLCPTWGGVLGSGSTRSHLLLEAEANYPCRILTAQNFIISALLLNIPLRLRI